VAFVNEPTRVVYSIYVGRSRHCKKEVKACGLIVEGRYLLVVRFGLLINRDTKTLGRRVTETTPGTTAENRMTKHFPAPHP
jgi:hypothetical protein